MCAGSTGKTTTSWLIRGMFDELDKSAGLIGTVEYGIDEFLMTEDGDLWKRDEPDPTLQRCASAEPSLSNYQTLAITQKIGFMPPANSMSNDCSISFCDA